MKRLMKQKNLEAINEAEEFGHNDKIKMAQISSLYKNNGQKYGNEDKSPGKKYLQKISPSKNYFFNKNMNNIYKKYHLLKIIFLIKI